MTADGSEVKEKLAEITKRAVWRQYFKTWKKLESQKNRNRTEFPGRKPEEIAAENIPKRRAPQKHP